MSPAVREALLEVLFASGADLLILPVQDVFGWRDRIDQPATVNDLNWTWRLPWPLRSTRAAARCHCRGEPASNVGGHIWEVIRVRGCEGARCDGATVRRCERCEGAHHSGAAAKVGAKACPP